MYSNRAKTRSTRKCQESVEKLTSEPEEDLGSCRGQKASDISRRAVGRCWALQSWKFIGYWSAKLGSNNKKLSSAFIYRPVQQVAVYLETSSRLCSLALCWKKENHPKTVNWRTLQSPTAEESTKCQIFHSNATQIDNNQENCCKPS